MHAHYPLSFHTGNGRVWTFGLSFLGHPELTMRADTLGRAREARSILFSLASLVLTTNARFEAGDAIHLGRQVVRLETAERGQLEVVNQTEEVSPPIGATLESTDRRGSECHAGGD
jgi:hypothetical protein